MYISAAASGWAGWAGWALAHPEFGSSVNPITTRGEDYAHPDLKTQRHLCILKGRFMKKTAAGAHLLPR